MISVKNSIILLLVLLLAVSVNYFQIEKSGFQPGITGMSVKEPVIKETKSKDSFSCINKCLNDYKDCLNSEANSKECSEKYSDCIKIC